jgi:UDPglucose 6-dehydrogenase
MTDDVRTLAVIGLGKLGAPMVACFASKGFEVIGVDVDAVKVQAVGSGKAPVFEPGLAELLEANRSRISATTDLSEAVRRADMTFIVVATPSDDEGGFSLDYVLGACETIGGSLKAARGYHVVVLTSTVLPGATDSTVRGVLEETSGLRCGVDFGLCYSPEFIALGSVIKDFLNPDFLLVGESDERAGAALEAVYARTCDNGAPVARMNLVNAELAKLSVNTYVTTKIAYANMLARICERLPGSDVDVVTAAIGLDTRIGPRYLRGTIPYGGPCFPRDNVALAALGRSIGATATVAEATDRANREGIRTLAALTRERLRAGGTVGVLGLSYKPDTDVVDESPALLLVRELLDQGVDVVAYDPSAIPNAKRVLGSAARFTESATACIAEADVVVLATPWPEFTHLEPSVFARRPDVRTVIDCWRVLPREQLEQVAAYVVLGEGARAVERAAAATE